MKSRIAPALHRLAHASGLSNRLARRRRAARIVMYHGVTSEEATRFASQIEYLATRFSLVPLHTILDRIARCGEPRPGELALTFDDGLRNNFTVVYPILRRLGVTATFFVCPGLIEARRWLWHHEARERLRSLAPGDRADLGRRLQIPSVDTSTGAEWMKRLPLESRARVETSIREATPDFAPTPRQRERFDLMSWEDLTSLDPRVIEIGSHTVNHVNLTALAPVDVMTEIEESQRRLQERLGRAVEFFAYPNGAYDARAITAVRKRYRGAVSSVPAVIGDDVDLHCVPRIPSADGLPLLSWRMHRPTA